MKKLFTTIVLAMTLTFGGFVTSSAYALPCLNGIYTKCGCKMGMSWGEYEYYTLDRAMM